MSNNQRNGRRGKNTGRNRSRKNHAKMKNQGGQEGNLVTRINPRFPSDVKQLPIHNRVFRFNANGGCTDFQITPAILLKLLVATISGSTAATPIIGSVRLRRISLYSVPSTGDFGNSTSELVFQWLGVLNTPQNIITDRGTATSPACIKVVPPVNSRAGMWYSTTSTDYTQPYFQFTCIATSVVDFDVDYIIINGASTAITLNLAAANTGVAFLSLNSGNLVPDGEMYIVRE